MFSGSKIKYSVSGLLHFLKYKIEKPKTRLEKGVLITSIDVDVGSKVLGIVNMGNNDRNVNDEYDEYSVGRIEEKALPLIIDFFNKLEIPVTLAIRGQLLDIDPRIIDLISNSPIEHEIGSHSYYHKDFTRLSHNEADDDLKLVSKAMKKFNIAPKSFIFPRNRIAHLDLLEKYGYLCYREHGDLMSDGRFIRKNGKLYDIHPSLYLDKDMNVTLTKKIIGLSIEDKVPFHVWFHPWNLGEDEKSVIGVLNKVFLPIFKYAKSKETEDELEFATMYSAVNKLTRG